MNGISTQVEQTVEDADAVQMQHVGTDSRKFLFLRIARSNKRRSRAEIFRIRGGKRLAVDFSIRRMRQFRQEDERGRNHVIGKRTADKSPQICYLWYLRRVRYDVGDKMLHTGLIFAR